MTFTVRTPMLLGWFLLVTSLPVLAAAQGGAEAPVVAPSHEQSGKQLFEAGRWAEAANEFAMAYAGGSDPSMLFNMALCHRRAGNTKRALALYQRFLVEAPDSPKRPVAEARIREIQDELAASAPATATPSTTKDATTYEQEGKRLFEAGRWGDAANEFEGAYSVGKDPGMLFNMALCYRRAGNAKRALALYQQYLAEVPDSPKRATVETRIQELQQEVATGPGAPQPESATAGGCQKDLDCKGTRICERGRCVEEQPKIASGTMACDPPCGVGKVCTKTGACLDADYAAPAPAPTPPPRTTRGPINFAIGVLPGYASGGSVSVDGSEVSPDGGMLLDLYFDKMLVSAFSVGGYATFTSMSWHGWSQYEASFQSVGVVAKGRFALASLVTLRPAATLGYNRMNSKVFDTITGINAGLLIDLAIAASDNVVIVTRLGFFSQPSGGKSGYDVTFGPHVYFAIGAEFGK
jgi:Tfp pilus assembly protein PilF